MLGLMSRPAKKWKHVHNIAIHELQVAGAPFIDAVTAALFSFDVAQACRMGLLSHGPSPFAWGRRQVILADGRVAVLLAASERLQFPACQVQLKWTYLQVRLAHVYLMLTYLTPSAPPRVCSLQLVGPGQAHALSFCAH